MPKRKKCSTCDKCIIDRDYIQAGFLRNDNKYYCDLDYGQVMAKETTNRVTCTKWKRK